MMATPGKKLEDLLNLLLGSSTYILVWARDHGEREELIRKISLE